MLYILTEVCILTNPMLSFNRLPSFYRFPTILYIEDTVIEWLVPNFRPLRFAPVVHYVMHMFQKAS